jgi:hypothetical protein
MALVPPPHPMAVCRVRKQPWREYVASGNALILAIDTIAGQAAAAPLTVSGTAVVDPATQRPFQVRVALMQRGGTVAAQTIWTAPGTGAWVTAPFAGGVLKPGSATATATVSVAPVVTSNTFTLT